MKVNILDAHDRHQKFVNENFSISECCQNLIDKRPFGDHAFYIFAHTRTDDDGFTKRLIWQPRLTKPKAQSNSMLFKAYPGTDTIKIMWMIPDRDLWNQYAKGKVTENETIIQSIHDFLFNRKKIESREEDDLSDDKIDKIYKSMSIDMKQKKMFKQSSLVASTIQI